MCKLCFANLGSRIADHRSVPRLRGLTARRCARVGLVGRLAQPRVEAVRELSDTPRGTARPIRTASGNQRAIPRVGGVAYEDRCIPSFNEFLPLWADHAFLENEKKKKEGYVPIPLAMSRGGAVTYALLLIGRRRRRDTPQLSLSLLSGAGQATRPRLRQHNVPRGGTRGPLPSLFVPTGIPGGGREQRMFTRRFTVFVSVAATLLVGALEASAQIEIVVRSGGASGPCGGTDPNTLVFSSSDPNPQPALIAGGNVAPECACGAPGNQDPNMFPVTTHSTGDTWGDFTTTFELPLGVTSPAMILSVRADDGAALYLNTHLLQTIDYYVSGAPTTHVIQDNDPRHFQEGMNTLRFYVVNTGNGYFGEPGGRGGEGDCMHVQYEARVTAVACSAPGYTLHTVLDAPGCTSVDMSPDRTRLYARMVYGDWDEGYRVFDSNTYDILQDFHPIGPAPWSGRVSADGQYLWTSMYYNGTVAKLNLATGNIDAQISVGSWPNALEADGTRRYMYAGQGSPGAGWNGSIKKIDTQTETIVGSAALTGEPSQVEALTSAGDYLYIATKNHTPSVLHKIRTSDMSVVGSLSLPSSIAGHVYLSLNPSGSEVYVPDTASNLVRVIDTGSMMETGTFSLAVPVGFFASPDGTHAFVMAGANDPVRIDIFDICTQSVTQSFPLTGHGVFNYMNTPVWDGPTGRVFVPFAGSTEQGNRGGVAVLVPEGGCGACCDDAVGDCIITTANECTFRYGGDGSTCATIDPACEPPLLTGACCDTLNGVCSEGILGADCIGDQRIWTHGASCAEVVCDPAPGACCDQDVFGTCTVTTVMACNCTKCVWHKLLTCEDIECTHTAIPTVSQWGLVVLTLLLLSGAKIYFARRQTATPS